MTLPEALRVAGYTTGMVGKWHLGDFRVSPQYHPRRNGFDFFAGFPYTNDEFPYQYWKNDAPVDELDWSVGEVVQALQTRGLLENTLIFFTSDNHALGPAPRPVRHLQQLEEFVDGESRFPDDRP